MKGLLGAIFKGGSSAFLMLIIVLLLVWFGGESLAVDKKIRIFVVLGVLGLALLLVLAQKVMAVRSALLIEQKLRAQAQEQVQSARPDQRTQVQAVEQQLNEAIQALKTSRLGKGALYKLPWYMIIGPPGSGKSTALQESGLNFPYVSQGRKGIRGVGGTRNCDWWFTDEGILLDTAGRYTTELDDRDEWLGFLDLMKRARRSKPINGVLVAVSISDLLSAKEEELEAHAKNIRERIDELTNRLQLVFPVYLLFTKCDLIQGFVEFFEDFTKQDRAQVWGCSLPYTSAGSRDFQQIFEEETQQLFRSVANQRLGSLVAERPAAKKQNVFLFPLQFQAATKKLSEFVGLLFRPNPFQETSVFRGFYFTSGTQEGTPIDQVIRSMSSAFGLKEENPSGAAPALDKKSYFINHLFTKIIFPDQTLAHQSTRVQRRNKIVHFATLGLSTVGSLLLLGALGLSFFGNRGLLADAQASAVKMRETERSGPARAALLDPLDGLRREVERLDEYDRGRPPMSLRWGLYRGNAINPEIRRVYFEALRKIFVSPCAEQIAKELEILYRKPDRPLEEVSELLRVYKILGGSLEAEKARDLVGASLAKEARWTAGLGGAPHPMADAHLRFFLSQLDRPSDWKVPIDQLLVARVTDMIEGGLLVFQAYEELVAQGSSRLSKINGETFVKGRGKDLLKFEYEFSSLFTQAGWDDFMKSAIRTKSESLSKRLSDLGIQRPADKLSRDLRERHVDRFNRHWNDFLKGVRILPFQHLADAADKMKVLAGDPSPLTELFKGVWEAQQLRTEDTSLPVPVELKPVVEARNSLYEFQQTVEEFVATTSAGTRVTGSAKEGKLQPLLEAFKKAGRGLDAAVRTAPPAAQERLKATLYQLIDNTRAALASEAQAESDAYWARTVHRVYQESIQGRFPYIDDFYAPGAAFLPVVALFRPKGGFWSTVDDLKVLNGLNLEGKPLVAFSREYNMAVRRGEAFREALFHGGGEKVNVPFKVTLKQREGVTHVRFMLGKKEFNHNERPDNRGDFVWEGEAGAKLSIRVGGVDRWIDFDRKPKGEGTAPAAEIKLADEWALFRLIAAGNPEPRGEKAVACTYDFAVTVTDVGIVKTFHADLLFEMDDRISPLQKDFFLKFVVPEKVGP
jgi:type VI secretion system IcmF/VasK family protein